MKADGTLGEIIKKWTESQSSSNSAVPETTTPCWSKATLKIKNMYSSDFILHHLSSKMENKYTGATYYGIRITIEINNPGFDVAVSDVQSGHAQGMIAGMTVIDAEKHLIFRTILHSQFLF